MIFVVAEYTIYTLEEQSYKINPIFVMYRDIYCHEIYIPKWPAHTLKTQNIII